MIAFWRLIPVITCEILLMTRRINVVHDIDTRDLVIFVFLSSLSNLTGQPMSLATLKKDERGRGNALLIKMK